MKPGELPPVELLRELFDYEPNTGLLRYRKRAGHKKAGSVAGTNINGYIQIRIKRKRYFAHRVCWAIYYNEQLSPEVEIDHIFGIKNDNRISELRKATRSENAINMIKRSNNTSGHRGVSWFKNARCWRSFITIGGITKWLGYFKNKEDAIAARLKAEKDNNIFIGTQ